MIEELRAILTAKKTITIKPVWSERDSQNLSLLVPLDLEDVTREGLQLRITAIKSMPEERVTAQLESPPATCGLCRVDWRPIGLHNNKGLGPAKLRHIQIAGTHCHRLDVNWDEKKGRWLGPNLSVAEPIKNDPRNFRELLALVGKEFTIPNIQMVDIPPWEPRLV